MEHTRYDRRAPRVEQQPPRQALRVPVLVVIAAIVMAALVLGQLLLR